MILKNQKRLFKKGLLFQFSQIWKRNIGIVNKLLILLLIIIKLFFLIIITLIFLAGIIFAIFNLFKSNLSSKILSNNYSKFTTTPTSSSSFINTIFQAVTSMLFLVLIKPALLLLSTFQKIMIFLSGGQLLNNLLFGNDNNFFHLPTIFLFNLGIVFGLLIILVLIRLIFVAWSNSDVKASRLKITINNFVFSLVGVFLIPIAFFIANSIFNSIIQILMVNGTGNNDIALIIFNNSFSNGVHNFKEIPQNWDFDDLENFNFIICLIAEYTITYMSFLLAIQLVEISFKILVLMIFAPYVCVWTIVDEGRKFFVWKEITINNFISLTFIFITYSLFISAVTFSAQIVNFLPGELGLVKSVLTLIILFASFSTVLKTTELIDEISGNQGIKQTINNINNINNTVKKRLTKPILKKIRNKKEN